MSQAPLRRVRAGRSAEFGLINAFDRSMVILGVFLQSLLFAELSKLLESHCRFGAGGPADFRMALGAQIQRRAVRLLATIAAAHVALEGDAVL